MSIFDYFFQRLLDGSLLEGTGPLVIVLTVTYVIASMVGRWLVFKKAGRTPWHSLIPFFSRYILFDISWYGWIAIVVMALELISALIEPAADGPVKLGLRSGLYLVLTLTYCFITIVMKLKLAKSFDLGIGYAFGLIFMEDLVLLVIGLQKKTVYYGKTLRKYNTPMPKRPGSSSPHGVRKKRTYLINITRRNSIIALTAAIIVAACTFLAVIVGLLDTTDPDLGENTYRLFTVNSNTLSAFGACLMIPYAVEGLRNKRFVIPKWVALIQYSGAICTTMTMLFTFMFIWPTRGAVKAFTYLNFWLHIINPISVMVLLFATESRHRFYTEDALLAMSPVYIYAIVYIYNVVLIGEKAGGWEDFYRLVMYAPAEFSGPVMIMFAFAIASGIRYVYNYLNERRLSYIKSIWSADMDPLDVNIEVYGYGRYIGLTSRDSLIIYPTTLFDDICENIPVDRDNLVRIYSKGVSEGLKEGKARRIKGMAWLKDLIGTPEFKREQPDQA